MPDTEHPLITRYREFSPSSQTIAERARSVFPGGDTRSSAHYGPYPLAIEHARGAVLTDADGHELLDFMNNFTSLIHGHAHPGVVTAVREQVGRGSAYAAPSTSQIELAELIADRVPSIEQLRFTSSGTEGTLMAIRAARAATGRQKLMKMEGGYHGSYEQAEVSLAPLPGLRGELSAPISTAFDASFPDSVLADTVICPYNEPQLARNLIDAHANELAAVIVEPILGSMGMLAATTEFLQTLRDATQRHGIILIFDEVITLRVNSGGAQATHGVTPDMTCMGKIIGGGLPVGGVGGRQELMQLFSPDQEQPVMHASTFSGNALTMTAGLAAMQAYTASEAQRINDLGSRLREGFNQVFQQAGVRGQATGTGSLSNLHFTDRFLHDARDSLDGMIAAGHIPSLLHLTMLRHGVMSATRLMFCTSTAMDESTVDRAVTALAESLSEMRPFIESERPELLI
ncbi:MAG: aspartate aminotransferase family protein [Pseudomonadales bacterium]|jgi:glutamate-1-semialdehyde 2,1-aminomutase|nr:aspartate aminotransferase family protein [Pseudomonadales bacterium]MDP6469804.1 aspartate aminotransferase family protein [Pseudomonadales bacterium]MDP6827594.1 aspartate aminotransferase family protein [Pseudomonadales bacterium]MDP6971274.1 aspartate aminotransferase family protein [Pseudomonadales bacterium]|tara:strand:- start:1051 stop:2427 length:1377 start_codon:yes stop_codon:yes gene_type:complete